MEKLVRDGKVAVLISGGWGAGFHTWGAPREAIFDPALVDLIENEKISEAITYVEATYPDAYTGGIEDLYIEWVPEGAKFIINEYDGSESIQLLYNTSWIIA
jgi:hypothetical protein